MHALRQPRHPSPEPDRLQDGQRLRVLEVAARHPQILEHGRVEEVRVLREESDVPAESLGPDPLCEVESVDPRPSPTPGGSNPARVISVVVFPDPLPPTIATRAPGGRSRSSGAVACPPGQPHRRSFATTSRGPVQFPVSGVRIRDGGVEHGDMRRDAIRARVSATAAAGSAAVASNADSGRSTRMPSAIGLMVPDEYRSMPMSSDAITLTPTASGVAASANALGAAARSVAATAACSERTARDTVSVEATRDAEFRGVIERR